jgi:Icc protein
LEAHKLIGKLERGKVDLALFGHIHSYYSYSLGTIPAFISGGGGGNEEKLDGISRHYLVLHINPQQIKGIELVQIPQDNN